MKTSEEMLAYIKEEGVSLTLNFVGNDVDPKWLSTIMIGDTFWARVEKPQLEESLGEVYRRLTDFLSSVQPYTGPTIHGIALSDFFEE